MSKWSLLIETKETDFKALHNKYFDDGYNIPESIVIGLMRVDEEGTHDKES